MDADPMDGQNWGHFGDEKNDSRRTAWDDVYDGELSGSAIFRSAVLRC